MGFWLVGKKKEFWGVGWLLKCPFILVFSDNISKTLLVVLLSVFF